jgi:hypothetical protein
MKPVLAGFCPGGNGTKMFAEGVFVETLFVCFGGNVA